MKIFEIILLTAGSLLFIFSLILITILVKRDKPYLKSIWLIIISFFMMGFSTISNAELFGVFKYEKEKKMISMSSLALALEHCPDNPDLKSKLETQITDFEKTEKATSSKEKAVLSDIYLTINNQDKALEYANKSLENDKTNKKAKAVKDIIKTEKIIKELDTSPKKDNKKLEQDYYNIIKNLEKNPSVSQNRLNKIKLKYQNRKKK